MINSISSLQIMDKLKSAFDTVLSSVLWPYYFETGVLKIKRSQWMHFWAIANINVSFIATKRQHLAILILWGQALCKACCRFSFLFSSQVTWDTVLICEIVTAFFVCCLTLWHNNCMATLFACSVDGVSSSSSWHDSLPTQIKGTSTQYAQPIGLPEPPFLKWKADCEINVQNGFPPTAQSSVSAHMHVHAQSERSKEEDKKTDYTNQEEDKKTDYTNLTWWAMNLCRNIHIILRRWLLVQRLHQAQ